MSEEAQRVAYEAAKKQYEKNKQFDAWQHEQDPVKRFKLYVHRYAIELLVLSMISIAAFNWLVGRSINKRIAFYWLKEVNQVLSNSFAYIPEDCKSLEAASSRVGSEGAG